MTTTPNPRPDRHADRPLGRGRVLIRRHPTWVRITHWITVVCVVALLMSGINILMAHPHLYWGVRSTFAEPWLSVPPAPSWAMMPPIRHLAEARAYHFLFAWIFVINGLVYLIWSLVGGRFRRQLMPSAGDLHALAETTVEHARLRFPADDRARAYNGLQKLTYLAMILIVLPLMLVTGLAMSPAINAAAPWLLDLLGGRQSARTLHFLSAAAIVVFIVVHVALVVWTGPVNNLRGMVTGRFVIGPPGSRAGPFGPREPRR